MQYNIVLALLLSSDSQRKKRFHTLMANYDNIVLSRGLAYLVRWPKSRLYTEILETFSKPKDHFLTCDAALCTATLSEEKQRQLAQLRKRALLPFSPENHRKPDNRKKTTVPTKRK